jgi:hypothetical protein
MPTPEELSAQVKDLEAKVSAANAESDKQRGIAENAEKLVQKWSAEVGELRKQAKESGDKLAEALAKISDLEQKISGSTTPGKKTKEEQQPTAEEIEKSLEEPQRKAVEAVYAQLKAEDKSRYHSDEQFRLAVLKEAQQRVQVVPESPWKKPDAGKKKDTPDADGVMVGALFDKVLKGARFTPPGGNGTAHRTGGDITEKPPKRIVVQGGTNLLQQLQAVRADS